MTTEPNKIIYSMVGVSKFYDKKQKCTADCQSASARWHRALLNHVHGNQGHLFLGRQRELRIAEFGFRRAVEG